MKPPIQKLKKKYYIIAAILICFVATVLWSVFFRPSFVARNNNSDEQVMNQLSEIIVLPEEIPTIATVSDREKLSDQPFFAKAENGDKVIIYVIAKRAYLYRPKENKIIDMTVVNPESAPENGGSAQEIPVFEINE